MAVSHYLKQLLIKYFTSMRWYALLVTLLVYLIISWLGLYFCNESSLIGSSFFYWLVVTASTVGYGDLSPATVLGQWFTAIFIIPVGLGLFALVLGRLAAITALRWTRGVSGLSTLTIKNHILVLGCNDSRTLKLTRLLIKEESLRSKPRAIVLCVNEEMRNPLPGEIDFIRTESFSDDSEMDRACVKAAGCIVIANRTDEESMTSALYCAGVNSDAHTIVYFDNEKLSDILKTHCPTIEVTPSVSVEMMAKATADRGSSELHRMLLTASHGMTQFSAKMPKNSAPLEVNYLFTGLKNHYDATLIAITCNDVEQARLNPSFDDVLEPGGTIYYIALHRIQQIDWECFYPKS